MKHILFGFFTAAFVLKAARLFALAEDVNSNSSQACNATHAIALDRLELDLLWMEPKSVENEAFARILNDNRTAHLKQLHDTAYPHFRNSHVVMVQVKDDPFEETGCLTCFGEKQLPMQSEVQTLAAISSTDAATMLRAATLAWDCFNTEPVTRSGASVSTDQPVLHAIVMVTEDYRDDALILGSKPFMGDETDTCLSNEPTQKEAQEVFRNSGIAVFLVTPNAGLKERWAKVFNPADSLSLYPDVETVSDSNNKFRYEPSADKLVPFVMTRLTQFACQHFPQFVIDVSKKTQAPETTPAAPTITATPPAALTTFATPAAEQTVVEVPATEPTAFAVPAAAPTVSANPPAALTTDATSSAAMPLSLQGWLALSTAIAAHPVAVLI